MLRRASLPNLPFNNSKRDRRLSTPSSPPLPPRRKHTRGFVRVKVSDFVTVPCERRSQPRNALGPVDLVKRPPCYDLRPNTNSLPSAHQVFEIPDRQHIDTLRTILKTSPESQSDSDTQSLESESVEHDKTQTQRQQHESDQELTDTYDDLREYDNETDVGDPVDPDLDFDKKTTTPSLLIAAISTEDTTITSTVLSTSSVADTSLSEFPTIASINTTGLNSDAPSSILLEDENSSVFVTVDSSQCLPEKKKSLPTFMRKKVPSPVKYTFRPLHRAPSKIEDRPESTQVTTIVPANYPSRLMERFVRKSDATRNSSPKSEATSDSSTSEHPSTKKSPTLEAVKSVIDKIDPHAAIGIAHVPPLALATVGFFRKKRDSEESIWSKKSDASSRKKRESDESTQSSNTEYYEDDYTKFIERKKSSPRSPLRLHNFPKIVHVEDGLKFSRSSFRRNSSMSVSTSDEEYVPLSDTTQTSNVS